MSDLQRELVKSKMESRKTANQDNCDWQAERWARARRDMAAGCFKTLPEPRFPVILTPDGPISSASKLQLLAELDSLPETVETSQVDWHGTEVKKVTICDVSYGESKRIKQKAEVLSAIEEDIEVIFNGEQRFAIIVTGLKEGITLGETDKDDGEKAEKSDD